MELEEVLLAAAAVSAAKDEQRVAVRDGLQIVSTNAANANQQEVEQRWNQAAAYRVPSAGGVAVAGRLDALPDAVVVQLLVLP